MTAAREAARRQRVIEARRARATPEQAAIASGFPLGNVPRSVLPDAEQLLYEMELLGRERERLGGPFPRRIIRPERHDREGPGPQDREQA